MKYTAGFRPPATLALLIAGFLQPLQQVNPTQVLRLRHFFRRLLFRTVREIVVFATASGDRLGVLSA